MNNESEFFVGYLPMPAELRKMLRRELPALGATVAVAAAILVAAQHPFAASTFEFQQYGDYQGVIRTHPYPALDVADRRLPWLLVAPGKHGAGDLVGGLDGQHVRLKGARIFRGEDRMLELLPGSVQAAGPAVAAAETIDLGAVQLTGEIVDSKCYLGVMNPGNGKVHRDCAVRCISGGIPPAFLVRDAAGQSVIMLLGNWKRELLGHVAEPIALHGRLTRSGGRLTLDLE
jgi:hypothetical protein